MASAVLANEMETDNVGYDSDESDDTSAYENVSEESPPSCSDVDQDNAVTDSQLETFEKAGVT